MEDIKEAENDLIKKWSLILGLLPTHDNDLDEVIWDDEENKIHHALSWVYEKDVSEPAGIRTDYINDWLKDVNQLFPGNIATVLQRDAIEKFGVELLLKSDAFLEKVIPDVQLAAKLLKIKGILPEAARQKAHLIIQKIVDRLIDKFKFEGNRTLGKALRSPVPTLKPKMNQINWQKTITRNLKNFRKETNSIIPEKLIGRKTYKKSIDSVIILVDQSASMTESLVYVAVYACIFNSIPALNTQLVLFDTEIADMTHLIFDPVELLLTTQLGGGTDIGKALSYVHHTAKDPQRTMLVLISDLDETEDTEKMLASAQLIKQQFKQFMVILALNDEGVGVWHKDNAREFANLNVTCVACVPDRFPDLIAEEIVLSRS